MFAGIFPAKKNIMKGAAALLYTLAQERTPEEDLAHSLAKTVMKDDDVFFVMRSFGRKFDVDLALIDIVPGLEEKSLTVSSWALRVNETIIIEKEGCEALLDEVTRVIMSKDEEELTKIALALKAAGLKKK